jgi:hypothetical protein
MGNANSKSGQAVRCVAVAVLPLMLAGCQAESEDRVVQKPNELTSTPTKLAAEQEGELRLIAGQELKHVLVGAEFFQDGGFRVQAFRRNGIYAVTTSDFANIQRRFYYKIFDDKFCLYEIEDRNLFTCGRVHKISESKFEFTYDDYEFQIIPVWQKLRQFRGHGNFGDTKFRGHNTK